MQTLRWIGILQGRAGQKPRPALTMGNLRDEAHVSDIVLLVHDFTDLVDGKLHHLDNILFSFEYDSCGAGCAYTAPTAAAGHRLSLSRVTSRTNAWTGEHFCPHQCDLERKSGATEGLYCLLCSCGSAVLRIPVPRICVASSPFVRGAINW